MQKILYQVGHYGFLINAMLHKMVYHKNDEAVFLLDKVIMNQFAIDFLENNSKNFKEIGKIYLYNDRDILNKITADDDELSVENKIGSYFDSFLKSKSVKLNEIDEFYSIFDTFNAFSVYLAMKKIPFNMIEGFEFQCQNEKRYFLNGNNKKYDAIINKYKVLSYNCEFVKTLYCAGQASINDKPVKLNNTPNHLLKMLSKQEIQRLIDCYGVQINNTTNDNVLFVLSSTWITGEMKLKGPYYFYLNQQISDYFSKYQNLIIKPHPNADFTKETWLSRFNDATIIPGYFPSVIMNHMNLKIKQSINTGSVGSGDIAENVTSLPLSILHNYKLYNKISYCFELAKYLKIDRSLLEHYGLHNDFIWSFQQSILGDGEKSKWSSLGFKPNSLTIIDDINWNLGEYKNQMLEKMTTLENNAIILFVNSKKDYSFITEDKRFVNNILPIRLKKFKLKEETLEPMEDEFVYVFCKDKEIIDKIKKFNFNKTLKNVGVRIETGNQHIDAEKDFLDMKIDYAESLDRRISKLERKLWDIERKLNSISVNISFKS